MSVCGCCHIRVFKEILEIQSCARGWPKENFENVYYNNLKIPNSYQCVCVGRVTLGHPLPPCHLYFVIII